MSNKKSNHGQRRSLLTGASLLAASAAMFGGAPALAQEEAEEDVIVVTGSRIPNPNLETTNPVTQLTAEDIHTQGVTRLEDLTNQLPQVFATQGSNVSNGASGTAEVSLRGLSSARTLVLVDGRRMPYGSDATSAADINTLPGVMVERVEVLTGGASAVYGSDAVSGVVNFIMRSDFEGMRFDGQYGFYQHNNDSTQGELAQTIGLRNATNPVSFNLPDEDVVDGYGKELSFVFGASAPDGRGNVTAYVTYRHNDAVLQGERDYSACSLAAALNAVNRDGTNIAGSRPGQPANTLYRCGGSGTSFPGIFTSPVTGTNTIDSATGNTFRAFNPNTDLFNFGPLNYYQRPDERYNVGAFAHYDINDRVEAYTQLMFSDYKSIAQIAPSGNFFSTNTLNCGNPLFGPGMAATLGCSPAQIAGDSLATPQIISAYIARRNVEGGGRQDTFHNNSLRIVGGIRGALSESWDYDVSAQYASAWNSRIYQNELSVARMRNALDVLDNDPGPGVDPQCRVFMNGTDTTCVPWNVFQIGGVTQAALSYLEVPLLRSGTTRQWNAVATATGDLGYTLPTADSPIAASLGVEYRRDYLERIVDNSFATGDGAGQGGPTLGFPGAATDVFELFGEVAVPIADEQPFAYQMSVNAAYRYSSYSNGETTDTYNIGADWAPVEDVRFRGSFARAVRAPNVIELFSAQGVGLFDMADDPCDSNDPAADGFNSAGVCIGGAPYQVTLAQSANPLLTSPAGQYNGNFGGNPNVSPESADTTTYGIVFQPSFLPRFTLSVDYFKIEVTNLIGIVGAASTVSACFGTIANPTSDPAACAIIARNPGNGRIWSGTGIVQDVNANIDGALETSGIDINANYGIDLGGMGDLSLALIATKLESYNGGCEGQYGAGLCGTPNPIWRGRFRATWETPADLSLHATVRYFDSVDYAGVTAATAPDITLEAQTYLDLAGNYDVNDNTRFRFGVNNVLDREPPLSRFTGAGFGNGNTFPQVYDSLGRWVFMGVQVDF